MKNNVFTGLFFIFSMLSGHLWAQHQDLQLWTSAGIRMDLSQKIRVSLEEEVRFFENIRRLDKLNTDISLDYQLTNLISIGSLYRLIANHDAKGYYEMKHRFDISVEFQKQVNAWTWAAQLTAQKTYPEFSTSENWFLPENYLRADAGVSRELKNKKTEPYLDLELWYLMPHGKQAFIDQYRLTVGIKQKVDKNNRWNIYYRIQQEIQVSDPLFAHIIGVGYTYVWKR